MTTLNIKNDLIKEESGKLAKPGVCGPVLAALANGWEITWWRDADGKEGFKPDSPPRAHDFRAMIEANVPMPDLVGKWDLPPVVNDELPWRREFTFDGLKHEWILIRGSDAACLAWAGHEQAAQGGRDDQ